MSRRRNKRRKSHAPRIRRLTPPGTAPGTLHLPADAARPSIHVIKYANGQFLEEPVDDVRCIGDLLDDQSVTWVNVSGLGDAEVLHALSDVFGLHGLAMEDVVNVHQRAKVEAYTKRAFGK
jgi:magnesium transporter